MSNFFYLQFDATPPTIEIILPPYTSYDALMPISILSNEVLLNFQEFYIYDAAGEKHDIILNLVENSFSGIVQLNDFSLGIATLYCSVCDEVGNISNLVSKSFDVVTANIFSVKISDYNINYVGTGMINSGNTNDKNLNKCDIKVYTMAVKLNG